MPGEPVIMTPRKLFMPFWPGFLKFAFRLSDLKKYYQPQAVSFGGIDRPVIEPLLKFLDLPLVTADLFQSLRGIPIGPKL